MSENPDHVSRKLTVAKARRIVGMVAKNYSDDEMQQIIDLLYRSAELSYRQFANGDQPD